MRQRLGRVVVTAVIVALVASAVVADRAGHPRLAEAAAIAAGLLLGHLLERVARRRLGRRPRPAATVLWQAQADGAVVVAPGALTTWATETYARERGLLRARIRFGLWFSIFTWTIITGLLKDQPSFEAVAFAMWIAGSTVIAIGVGSWLRALRRADAQLYVDGGARGRRTVDELARERMMERFQAGVLGYGAAFIFNLVARLGFGWIDGSEDPIMWLSLAVGLITWRVMVWLVDHGEEPDELGLRSAAA